MKKSTGTQFGTEIFKVAVSLKIIWSLGQSQSCRRNWDLLLHLRLISLSSISFMSAVPASHSYANTTKKAMPTRAFDSKSVLIIIFFWYTIDEDGVDKRNEESLT